MAGTGGLSGGGDVFVDLQEAAVPPARRRDVEGGGEEAGPRLYQPPSRRQVASSRRNSHGGRGRMPPERMLYDGVKAESWSTVYGGLEA